MSTDIVIVTVVYDPVGNDVAGEYVEIANRGGTAVDLTGWRLRDRADHKYDFPQFELSPGARVKVWTKAGTDSTVDLFQGRAAAIWNNRPGDVALLQDATPTEVARYDYRVPARTGTGLGGGGAMYRPVISPHQPGTAFVACDMGGLYRTTDGGASWQLLDTRVVRGSARFGAAYDPHVEGHVIAFNPWRGLQESFDGGAGWSPFSPALPIGADVTAAAFPTTGQTTMLIGTTRGVYALTGGQWQQSLPPGTDDTVTFANGATVTTNRADVVDFGIVTDPQSSTEAWYVATVTDILRWDPAGGVWISAAQGLPARSAGPYIAAKDDFLPPVEYFASRIRGFASAQAPGRFALYATIRTEVGDIASTGGVYRLEQTATAAGQWERQMQPPIELRTGDRGGGTNVPRYEHLALAPSAPDTVMVSCWNIDYSPNVYRGEWSGGQLNWSGVYNGYQNNTATNVDGGWLDQDDGGLGRVPVGLGWGFGGPARGLSADPANADRVLMTNNGVVHRTGNGGTQWQQRYSSLTAGAAKQISGRWDTIGLDVTTVWHYIIHPDPQKQHIHFVCSTDIGLARSETGGDRWDFIGNSDVPTPANKGPIRRNFYEFAFEKASLGNRIWAATSDQHDIPHDTQHGAPYKSGWVLVSGDDGASWTTVTNSGLPQRPIVSVIRLGTNLFVSAWGDGVYRKEDSATGWTKIGPFPAGTSPHCYRLHTDATGALHCVVAPKRTGSVLARGGLYQLTESGWVDLTADLPAIMGGAVLAPVDYSFRKSEPGAVYLCAASVNKSNGGGGLYRRDATGVWTAIPIPFKPEYHDTVQAFAPFFDPDDDAYMYVTTTSHGVWLTPHAGKAPAKQKWTEVDAIPFLATQRLTFHPADSSLVYIATFGAGAQRVRLPAKPTKVPLRVTETSAPLVNFVWDADGTITVTDTSDDFVLNGTTGTAFLQSRTWPVGEPGTQAEGRHGIEWRIHMHDLLRGTAAPSVREILIDVGPIVSLDYNADGVAEHVYQVTTGGIGDVKIATATQTGNTVRFVFEGVGIKVGTASQRGQSSFFFGLTSAYPAATTTVTMIDSAGNQYELEARSPAHP